MIDLAKNNTSLFEDELEVSADYFKDWLRGYISYCKRFYDKNYLPSYMSHDIDTYLTTCSNEDSWSIIYWLRGYLEHVDAESLLEFKGSSILLKHLSKYL